MAQAAVAVQEDRYTSHAEDGFAVRTWTSQDDSVVCTQDGS